MDNFSKIGVYDMQDDVLMDTLTVQESLMFAATLKIEGSAEKRQKLVDDIIQEF